MKQLLVLTLLLFSFDSSYSQMMITTEAPEVEGLCNNKQVYALFSSFSGHTEPKCSLNKEQIQALLNEKVTFLKENPKFKGKGSVSVYINCKGEIFNWKTSTETKSPDLDKEILAVFQTLTTWRAGKFNGQAVDC